MDADSSVVIVHDPVNDRQAETGAAAFRREVREKEFFLVAVGNAAAGIGHGDRVSMMAGVVMLVAAWAYLATAGGPRGAPLFSGQMFERENEILAKKRHAA